MEGFIVILNEVKNPNGRGKVSISIQRLFPASVGILRRCIPQNDTQGNDKPRMVPAPTYKRL